MRSLHGVELITHTHYLKLYLLWLASHSRGGHCRRKHQMQLWQHLNEGLPEVTEGVGEHGNPSISYDTTTLTHCQSMSVVPIFSSRSWT